MPIGYRIDCFWSSIDRSFYEGNEWQADYGIDYRGGLAEIGQTIGYDAFYNIGIEAYQALYRFPSLPRFDTLLAKEWIVGPSLQWEFNTLDDLYLPSKGFEYRLNMLYSNATIGGTKEFLRVDFSAEHFIPLGSWMLLHPSIILGTCFGELSWSNYFYTGGPDFIGFNTEEFTTTDRIIGRLDLGFRMFNLFNQKDYPVYLQLISNIATFESIDRILETGLKLDNTHLGVGVGIKTNTPIGPFQISVGCADFHKQPAEDNFRTALFVQIGRDFRYTK
jgi:outer membrane protein assembly factor BamA